MSVDNKAPTVNGEGITDGIDISNWSVNRNNQTLTFNVWDFAGQTVYYNTHQVIIIYIIIYYSMYST